ncbi:hypothetical protein [Parasphingorhabdus sp.]|uniref:hypothetical protein n=1 Tax=Parasphingorhabdus sp. TaxID=2709688 RepID=UPI003266DD16
MMDKQAEDPDREDTMQRIQVGVIGLAVMLLLVSIANFVIELASDEQTVIEELQSEEAGNAFPVASTPEEKPAEPLAELGITPAPEPEIEQPEVEAPAANLPGQIVPDLKPDPNLDAPMDQEQQ